MGTRFLGYFTKFIYLVQVEWFKNDSPIEEDGRRFCVDQTDKKSSMCINKAKREDTGKYTIKVKSEAGEDTYDIVVRVIDIPSQLAVKIKIKKWYRDDFSTERSLLRGIRPHHRTHF